MDFLPVLHGWVRTVALWLSQNHGQSNWNLVMVFVLGFIAARIWGWHSHKPTISKLIKVLLGAFIVVCGFVILNASAPDLASKTLKTIGDSPEVATILILGMLGMFLIYRIAKHIEWRRAGKPAANAGDGH